MHMQGLRVAVIGAGPAGVVAIKALQAEKDHFVFVKGFERCPDVGGAWNHTPEYLQPKETAEKISNMDLMKWDDRIPAEESDDPQGPAWHFPTPMYAQLNTNIPEGLMCYNDAAFPLGTDTFPDRQTVLEYLKQYAKGAKTRIAFQREVTSVRKDLQKQTWIVQSISNLKGGDRNAVSTESFDRVVIATGHYELPNLPDIPGLAEFDTLFPSVIRHSKYYRTPSDYAGKTTLIVGSGPSAIDITSQIVQSSPSSLVIWSSRSPMTQPLPTENQEAELVAEIDHLTTDGSVVLKDGKILRNVDIILFCTGYLYSFPYLDQQSLAPGSPLVTDGERLQNLYEHLFYIPDPTLAVLAMNMNIVPFCFAEAQACFMSRVWAGRIKLPSTEDMNQWQRLLIEAKGDSRRAMFLAHPEDGEYIDRLRSACIEADKGLRSGGMYPVDWMNTKRLQLRKTSKELRVQWLMDKRKAQLS